MLFVIGLVLGILAYKVGKWRHLCIFWQVHNCSWNLPLGWRKLWFQLVSGLLVMALSIGFATCWSLLFMKHVGGLFGAFSWGALLSIRWIASGTAAVTEGEKRLAKMQLDIATRTEDAKGDLS